MVLFILIRLILVLILITELVNNNNNNTIYLPRGNYNYTYGITTVKQSISSLGITLVFYKLINYSINITHFIKK